MKDVNKKGISLKEIRKKIKIQLKKSGINIGIFCAVILIVLFFQSNMPPYQVNYEQESISSVEENEETMNTVYHYYLDFSPSMEGFFAEGIDSTMEDVAEAFKEINTSGNEKKFFCCADEIETVSEDVLYRNMESTSGIREYYDSIIYNAGMDIEETYETEDIEAAINAINLAEIFYLQYGERQSYETGKESLNVIITDLNFKKNSEDAEGQEALIREFAEYLGKKGAESNIAVYQIYSNFAGITSDEYELNTEYGVASELQSFFIIVESQNNTVYANFTNKLESQLNKLGVDCSEKYELVNRVSDGETALSVDVNALKRNNWIEKENFNYDNQAFKEIESNEMGLRMVEGTGMSFLSMRTTPIQIIGCNNTGETKTGDVQIEVKTKVSCPINNKEFETMESSMISSIRSGTVWEQEKMYLTVELEMNPSVVHNELENISQNILFQKKYFVIELQFFLEKPDYTLPEWLINDENMQDKIEVYNCIIENKENTFADLNEEQRYLGNVVLYITY